MNAAAGTLSRAEINRATISLIVTFAVGFGVFLSGFVIREPAPYELYMTGLIGVWVLTGFRLSASVMPLLLLLVVFNVGGLISMTQMADLKDAPLYIAVSLFLAFSAVFFAAVIEQNERLLATLFNAWTAAAVFTGLLGIIGYLGLLPGFDIFTRYDRAMGAFQDPNVFGPFLILPSLWMVHGLLARPLTGAPWRIAVLLVLALAIFLSFSRAAWGLLALSTAMLTLLMFIGSRSGAFRIRIIVMTLVAIAFLAVAVIVMLQFDKVSDLFFARASLSQEYDTGRLGRFGRHIIGFQMAMEHPLGIGPLVFGPIFGEDTHNIWLKALLDYSWLGFASYMTLTIWTLIGGFRLLLRDRPWQPFLLCAWIVYVGHVVIGNVIDTDHWRHFYLLVGVIWGCMALETQWRNGLGEASPS